MLSNSGQSERAAQAFEDLLALEPDHIHGLNGLGVVRASALRLADAIAFFERSLALLPNQPETLNNLGNCYMGLGELELACRHYKQAIALWPEYADALFNLGKLYVQMNRGQEAIVFYQKTLAIQPQHTPALINLAKVHLDERRPQEALDCLQLGLTWASQDPVLWFSIGVACDGLLRLDQAIEAFTKAIDLKNDYHEARINRANAYTALHRFQDALDDLAHARASEDKATLASMWAAYALIYPSLGREQEVEVAFRQAMMLNPDDQKHRVNLGFWLLKHQRWAEAWPLYRERHEVKGSPQPQWLHGLRIWRGEEIKGRVLLVADQGLGDEVFHTKCLHDWIERWGPPACVTVDQRMLSVFQSAFPQIRFMARSTVGQLNAGDFDVQVALGDLPVALGIDPVKSPKVSSPHLRTCVMDGEKGVIRTSDTGLPRIGLSWRSSNAAWGAEKSMVLQDLIRGVSSIEANWINLQYGEVDREIAAVRNELGIEVQQIPGLDVKQDLEGLLKAIQSCDVVLTTSNSTAHFCGAIGKHGVVMVPYSLGKLWYWHTENGSSPWYPSLHILHSPQLNDWTGVLDSAVAQLKKILQAGDPRSV